MLNNLGSIPGNPHAGVPTLSLPLPRMCQITKNWIIMKRLPQTKYPLGTPFNELPETITRQCCSRKRCTTHLYRRAVPCPDKGSPSGASMAYSYVRGNDEPFFSAATGDELIEQLNDESYWPVDLNADADG